MDTSNGSYNLSAHAVIVQNGQILQVKANYGDRNWGLPGGKVDPGETIHEAVKRECQEEIGVAIKLGTLTGVYYHKACNSHVFIFRAETPEGAPIVLSEEHTAYKFFDVSELTPVQKIRVQDCLGYDGTVKSAAF